MYLLNTNVFFKYLVEPQSLPGNIQIILNDPRNAIFVSAVVPWELAIKHAKGKLPKGEVSLASYEQILLKLNMKELAVTGKHAIHAGRLPPIHQDPFDRLIIAQGLLESLTILSLDSFFQPYGVAVITR
ncbi:type II toxin-antitoxin system VapC family toxin [soil metagenome]